MALLELSEADVVRLLPMADAIDAVEDAFRRLQAGTACNVPRARCQTDAAMLHLLSAADAELNLLGYKAYTTTRNAARFEFFLFDGTTGEPLARMAADHLGRIRTGAATGVATKYLARPDAASLGIFGAGKQARAQVQAVRAVRPIGRAIVAGRTPERAAAFVEEIRAAGAIEARAGTPEEAAACDIVVTATTSRQPVLCGDWLRPGCHLNVIGSNHATRAEVDAVAVRRSRVFVDSGAACRIEAGDLIAAGHAWGTEIEWARW